MLITTMTESLSPTYSLAELYRYFASRRFSAPAIGLQASLNATPEPGQAEAAPKFDQPQALPQRKHLRLVHSRPKFYVVSQP